MNADSMHKRIQLLDSAHASSSATQTLLIVDLSTRMEQAYSLIQATALETKALSSRVESYARIPAQLARSWTQEPAMVEDALGRVIPFHLEFIDSWEVGHIHLCRVTYQADLQGS